LATTKCCAVPMPKRRATKAWPYSCKVAAGKQQQNGQRPVQAAKPPPCRPRTVDKGPKCQNKHKRPVYLDVDPPQLEFSQIPNSWSLLLPSGRRRHSLDPQRRDPIWVAGQARTAGPQRCKRKNPGTAWPSLQVNRIAQSPSRSALTSSVEGRSPASPAERRSSRQLAHGQWARSQPYAYWSLVWPVSQTTRMTPSRRSIVISWGRTSLGIFNPFPPGSTPSPPFVVPYLFPRVIHSCGSLWEFYVFLGHNGSDPVDNYKQKL
jgi:hypothetical protein